MRRFLAAIGGHPLMARHPALRQFVKFSLVGVSNTAVDFLLYAFLTRVVGLHYLAANVLSFGTAATWSYLANRTWTFRDRASRIRTQYPKFVAVSVGGLLLTTLSLYVLVHVLGVFDLFAKVLTIGLTLFWNFLLNRYWTFRRTLVAR